MTRTAFLALLTAGCASPREFARLDALVAGLSARHEAPAPDPEADRPLEAEVDAETLVRVALARNPDLREALARARAARHSAVAAGRLGDPVLSLRTEGVSLRRPGSVNRAEWNMLSLTQDIPFPGNLAVASEASLREAEAAVQTYHERELELVSRVKRAFFEYAGLVREIEIHREHVKILEDLEKVSDARFRTGQVSQQDVLKPQVELVRLHNEIFSIEQRVESSRAQLNALLNRPAGAALGPPRELRPREDAFDLPELTARALASRPDLRAAELKAQASRAAERLAGREARLPSFSVEFGYMQMPDVPDAWAGTLAVNLPWLTGKRAAEARRMEQLRRADESAVEGVRNRVLFEVRDAFLRVEAARKSVALFGGELLPKSAQSVEVSRASYEKDKASFLDLLDAERSQRDVKLSHYQALARLGAALADLERAVGAEIGRKP